MKITPSRPFRVNRDGQSVQCDGFMIEIYDSKEKKNAVDIIYAAVGYELLENDIHEAQQLAKDYIKEGYVNEDHKLSEMTMYFEDESYEMGVYRDTRCWNYASNDGECRREE